MRTLRIHWTALFSRSMELQSISAFKVLRGCMMGKGERNGLRHFMAEKRQRKERNKKPREEDVALIFIRGKRENCESRYRLARGIEMKCKCLNEPLRDWWSTYTPVTFSLLVMESATRFHQPFRDYEEPFDISPLRENIHQRQ